MPSLERQAVRAAQDGLRYLLARQGRDGFWRDFDLQPGPSDVWSTAWIGWCLSECRWIDPAVTNALAGAVRVLSSAVKPDGWGYNHSSGPDADTTAWTCRLLAAHNLPMSGMAMQTLGPYLDGGGAAHTFREPGVGSWGEAHADVTPIVGLALAEAGGVAVQAIPLIRNRVVHDQRADGNWSAFWWCSNVYATAWSLVFLRTTGGICHATAARARAALTAATATSSVTDLERSLLLIAWNALDPAATTALEVLDGLLARQLGSGGWPTSSLLLVPERFPEASSPEPVPHADESGLMTTAMACAALVTFLHARQPQARGS